MKSKALIILFFISAACLIGFHSFSKRFSEAESTQFRSELEPALEEARSSNRPVFLYFGGSW